MASSKEDDMTKELFALLVAGTLMVPLITPALGADNSVGLGDIRRVKRNSDRGMRCGCRRSDDLLHPAQAFSHPSDVVNDPDLTLNEKRAILASWASDACAVESAPAFRRAPDGGGPIGFDDVAARSRDSSRYRREVRRRRILGRTRGSGDSGHGQPLY
jgi:hypothetical protein